MSNVKSAEIPIVAGARSAVVLCNVISTVRRGQISYFELAVKNLKNAELKSNQTLLFQ